MKKWAELFSLHCFAAFFSADLRGVILMVKLNATEHDISKLKLHKDFPQAIEISNFPG